ncbi:MAG: TetR/AcrR family transcriptional regulator [Sedimentisphaerales bacterium]|nr:TetR/AcrR family transcriptional regulator [Sedimentisphaerales bacterium]
MKAIELDTRDRILDVAERLFAEHGIDAVSVRKITAAAKVNLAAVNYYFGSKDGLIGAVVERRVAPLSQRQVQALDAVRKGGKGRAPRLDLILEAFCRPMIEQAMDPKAGGAVFGRFMVRCLADPNPIVGKKVAEHFGSVGKRFYEMLVQAVPGMPQEDLWWRMHLLMGGLHHCLMILTVHKASSGRRCMKMDADKYVKRFVSFAAAALKVRI